MTIRGVIPDHVESLQRELDEERTRTRQLSSDFTNFRRRIERETVCRESARTVLLPNYSRVLQYLVIDPLRTYVTPP